MTGAMERGVRVRGKELTEGWARWRRGLSIRTVLTLSSSAVALAVAVLMGGGLLLWLSRSGRLNGTAADWLCAFGVLLLCSALLAGVLSFRASARIAGPIRRLEQAVKELEAGGEPVELDEEAGCLELRQLNHSIRSMVSTMRHLMEDIIEQEGQKRRSELEVLHSQINPHFLYNTLDSVVWMTESGRTQEAVQMVTSLARLFRISLSGGERVIRLESELEHARHYLNIQQIRYKDKFRAQVTAHPGTEGLYALKLTIQPLLENAIYHGLAGPEEDGLITVDACREGDALVIDVADNGVGMRREQVETLLDAPARRARGSGSGIGLYNVHRRIQLTFGEEWGLAVTSEPDEGTRVRVRLPILDGEEAARYNQADGR